MLVYLPILALFWPNTAARLLLSSLFFAFAAFELTATCYDADWSEGCNGGTRMRVAIIYGIASIIGLANCAVGYWRSKKRKESSND